ncbi:hypothetical protein ALC62_11486 [Cyphomyrmex costatus]|uniref:Uncharacterized protein n=1 Tax=Cyphomyrmex costatus TaxID=456900 RepID=A0A151ICQ3_9HYME|nr:hypothetical protein ALC62_11486 [Cyphomyrmex costatus]
MSEKKKGITLGPVERNIFVRGEWLTDTHIDHFQQLLASCSDYKPVETWRIQLLDTIHAVAFSSKNYIKFKNPAAIENIFNKLDIKNHVEKRLEAERIVCRCTLIRDSYVRDMYKILALLKKKSKVCLSLATKCKTIDEKLCALCGKSKHTASSKNYFIDGTYRNISSSQILVINMEGQITNVLPLIEAQGKKSWLCDNSLCKIHDQYLTDCYEKVLQSISICTFKKIPQ